MLGCSGWGRPRRVRTLIRCETQYSRDVPLPKFKLPVSIEKRYVPSDTPPQVLALMVLVPSCRDDVSV